MKFVVLHSELSDGAVHLGSNPDKVGKNFSIIRARILVGFIHHQQPGKQSGGDDGDADRSAQVFPRRGLFRFQASLLLPSN